MPFFLILAAAGSGVLALQTIRQTYLKYKKLTKSSQKTLREK